MKECNICRIVENKAESIKVYEDSSLLAILHPKPATTGHIVLLPKEHYPIVENIPSTLLGHMFNIASKISSSVFEGLKVQGTNIFVQNGIPAGQTIPHVMVHIIPRAENDGLNLMWSPKQINEEEMSAVELKIKEETKDIGVQPKLAEVPKESKPAVKEGEKEETFEENYLLKQLRRIP